MTTVRWPCGLQSHEKTPWHWTADQEPPRHRGQSVHRIAMQAWQPAEETRRFLSYAPGTPAMEATHRCSVRAFFNSDHIMVEGRSLKEFRKGCVKRVICPCVPSCLQPSDKASPFIKVPFITGSTLVEWTCSPL